MRQTLGELQVPPQLLRRREGGIEDAALRGLGRESQAEAWHGLVVGDSPTEERLCPAKKLLLVKGYGLSSLSNRTKATVFAFCRG
ncbi:MAG: hypothetical protein AB1714_05735 [Acidobacteriota bacterium]